MAGFSQGNGNRGRKGRVGIRLSKLSRNVTSAPGWGRSCSMENNGADKRDEAKGNSLYFEGIIDFSLRAAWLANSGTSILSAAGA